MSEKKDRRDPAPTGYSKRIKVNEHTYFRVCDQCRELVTMREDHTFESKVVKRFEGVCKLCGTPMRVEKPA